MIYLASPYSTPKPIEEIEEVTFYDRYIGVLNIAIDLIKNNYVVFSPIVYTWNMQLHLGVDARTWQQFNDAFQRACTSTWIADIKGWQESVGVRHEIEFAKELKHDICLVGYTSEGKLNIIKLP